MQLFLDSIYFLLLQFFSQKFTVSICPCFKQAPDTEGVTLKLNQGPTHRDVAGALSLLSHLVQCQRVLHHADIKEELSVLSALRKRLSHKVTHCL